MDYDRLEFDDSTTNINIPTYIYIINIYNIWLTNMMNIDSDDNADNNVIKYKMYILEGVGWIGSILVLIPYVVHFSKTNDFVLNTTGASGLLVVCVSSKQYQSIVINAAWIVGGIYKYFFSWVSIVANINNINIILL